MRSSSSARPAILAFRKIYPALQALIKRHKFDKPIIGVSRSAADVETLRARARASVEAGGGVDPEAFPKLASLLRYVRGDYEDPSTYVALRAALGEAMRPLYYLAIPPESFATVANGLAASGCHSGGRVVVEKPFGRDLEIPTRAQRDAASMLPRAGDLPNRPLPGQGTGSEPYLLPLLRTRFWSRFGIANTCAACR